MVAPFEALFLEGSATAGGQRFALFHPPAGVARGAVLYLHPMAEEMNKSRPMAAACARALANAGMGVLQIDLLGCGDSSGDFGDATWSHWLDDVQMAAHWLQTRCGGALWLWGLRAGCLLAADAARRLDGPCNLLFWQPPTSGKLLLQQFLRMKLAAALQDGGGKGLTEALKARLAAGESVDIAGYRLNPGLALGLEAATLQAPLVAPDSHLLWLEVTTRDPTALSPAAAAAQASWSAAGWQTQAAAVPGPAFWQTQEIETAPQLIKASIERIMRSQAGRTS